MDGARPATMRCFGDGDELYADYHYTEWGRPVSDEAGVFERLCLEAFQVGLSWLLILRKRAAFRRAFARFDPDAVAAFAAADATRLLADPGIVRNAAKINAAIANARATVSLRAIGRPLPALAWSYAQPPGVAPSAWADVPATTVASTALARELKRHGFRFVGPTTAYATMQAMGLVNDHLAACPVRSEVEAQQEAARTGWMSLGQP